MRGYLADAYNFEQQIYSALPEKLSPLFLIKIFEFYKSTNMIMNF
jgi:hypothetical protein